MAGALRICWNIFPILFAAAALTFTLLVVISGTSANNSLADIYFMRINTTEIIPDSLPWHSNSFTSVAQSLGLHDFYQNSLWGYCEGYNQNSGKVTGCSKPVAMYAFDPTQIISKELFAGQSITIPLSIQSNLGRLHTASRWMFALYIVGVVLAFITVLVGFTSLRSRSGSVWSTFLSFLTFLFVGAATLVAQILFLIYKHVIDNTIPELNVSAKLGTKIFAFSWIATVAAWAAFFGFLLGICCSAGEKRRAKSAGKYRYEFAPLDKY